jgi:hypothetical protein
VKSALPTRPGTPTPAEAITPDDAEPDVTWGRGGIDDWGWTADAEAADDPVDQAGGGE